MNPADKKLVGGSFAAITIIEAQIVNLKSRTGRNKDHLKEQGKIPAMPEAMKKAIASKAIPALETLIKKLSPAASGLKKLIGSLKSTSMDKYLSPKDLYTAIVVKGGAFKPFTALRDAIVAFQEAATIDGALYFGGANVDAQAVWTACTLYLQGLKELETDTKKLNN